MAQQQVRPTSDVSDVILDSMDGMFEQLLQRLDGLTLDEYLWEPAVGMWSVRPGAEGIPVADGAGGRDVDPAPVTTIAWRMWHIAIDCLDGYSRRFAGDLSSAPAAWTLDVDEAVGVLQRKWISYRSSIAERDWWEPLGDNWGPWSQHSVADMAMHASNELVHHGAEIALLRDLYRAFHTSDGSFRD